MFSTNGKTILSNAALSSIISIFKVLPSAFLRKPSSPTRQPASSNKAFALRKLARSIGFVPDTGAITATFVNTPAGKSLSKGGKSTISSAEGIPVAAKSEFSQNELILAYCP
jgi:hypothetical protein